MMRICMVDRGRERAVRQKIIVLFSLGFIIALAACAPKELGSSNRSYKGEKDALYAVVLEAASAASVEFKSDNWVVSRNEIENHFLELKANMCCQKKFIGISWGKNYETLLSVKLTHIKENKDIAQEKGTRITIKGGLNTAAMANRIWELIAAEFPRLKPARHRLPS